MYNIYTNMNNIYKNTIEDSNDGLRKEKRSKRKKIKRKKEGILLKNHQATMALLISLPNTRFEENQEKDEKRKGCMIVPSYKGS